MRAVVERLATKPWMELTGYIIGMGVATTAVLVDLSRSRSYDATLCVTAGGEYCEEPLLPPAIDWALVAVGVGAVILVFAAIGLKLSRRNHEPSTGAGPGP